MFIWFLFKRVFPGKYKKSKYKSTLKSDNGGLSYYLETDVRGK